MRPRWRHRPDPRRGDVGWYWHLVEAELRREGKRRSGAGSSVRRLIDEHGIRRGGSRRIRRPDRPVHQDVDPALVSWALRRSRTQSEARMGQPSAMQAWPVVPTRVLLCRNDRLFPVAFLRRVARDRLGITPDEVDGGTHPRVEPPNRVGRPPPGIRRRRGSDLGLSHASVSAPGRSLFEPTRTGANHASRPSHWPIPRVLLRGKSALCSSPGWSSRDEPRKSHAA